MDRSKRDLETLVSSQKEQLARYEKRLKDVVTAYKGLLKEKEALESSLSAMTTTSVSDKTNQSINASKANVGGGTDECESTVTDAAAKTAEEKMLQTQIMTLMNSLATLSAEKSRMEASFQADKKQLRVQLQRKEETVAELKKSLKENEEKAKICLDEMKAKWIIECQEREKETNNQMVMIRELQKLYADERHLKENVEMQLNNLKTQFSNLESESARVRELQAQLKEVKSQLNHVKASGSDNEHQQDCFREDNVTNAEHKALISKQLQEQMQQLKEQHAIAIRNEKRRVLHAEEQSRRQAALHEDRVANLEARLAELSSTVGNYDRLRQQDQDSIQILRRKLHDLEQNTDAIRKGAIENVQNTAIQKKSDTNTSSTTDYDITAIVDEIIRLKKLLLAENSRTTNSIDLTKIFPMSADHSQCREELEHLQRQCDACKAELLQQQQRVDNKNAHITTLQEKVKVLNRNIDEQEIDLKNHAEQLRNALKEERAKWKSKFDELENETRCKVVDLEQQLQKQRQRSLQLLEEKDQEIKTLQTSFEIFHNANLTQFDAKMSTTVACSDAESNGAITQSMPNKTKKMSVGENCHMLHYANEIARKDIEIAGLRKAKYCAESALRKAIQEKAQAQEQLSDKIAMLEEEVDRLERCKTREGANLEYLKNVVISYIVTRDLDGKRHMLNAISAVLQFTNGEMQTINNALQKK